MMDLTQHFPESLTGWIAAYEQSMGSREFNEYYNKVFMRLATMQSREKLIIPQVVAPKNYDLFIKCAVLAINELFTYKQYFDIEEGATIIIKH